MRRILPVLVVLVVFAGVLGVKASFGSPSPAPGRPVPAAVDLETLLNDGDGFASLDYLKPTSGSLVRAAAGKYNLRFYKLGELLVKDGFSNTILDLGREMNGTWYEWSEHRAPPSEPDAFVLAWQQIVTTMRSVPGQHFKFLWTIYPVSASVADAWPGSAYVDYIGTDIFDWHGVTADYPRTKSGALDHEAKWRQILTAKPGGLNWMAAFSRVTGKPIIIPEWGLDFHSFGGGDDPLFVNNMMAWMRAHHAIGLYWAGVHVSPAPAASGPLLVSQGGSAQVNTPGAVNGLGNLMGGHLQYAGVYLPDGKWIRDSVAEPVLAPWVNAGYQLVLSVPIVPNPSWIRSYSGPPEPGNLPYQLADYPDVVAALRHGAAQDRLRFPALVPPIVSGAAAGEEAG